jgi:two-component system, OmpR family, copper resistance phosphate regulon response regulator CusR
MPAEINILIVEDEVKIGNSLKQGLEELFYKVTVALDGFTGKKLFLTNSFDLVILDINLPQINGMELCKIFRQHNKKIPILMLTAFGSTDDKVQGFDAGADDYLVKPFDFKELLVRIKALFRRADILPLNDKLSIGDLVMDLGNKEVTRNGKQIKLTLKEFQLLEYMLRNKNHLVSRTDIAEKVWDLDFDTGTNIIDVYVNYLRRKIDKDFSPKLIYTQVGFGYMLKEYPEDPL